MNGSSLLLIAFVAVCVIGQRVAASQQVQAPIEHADQPLDRTDANSLKAPEQLLAKRTPGRIDVYFMGDSLTRR